MNDQILSIIRVGYQAVITAVLSYLLRLGIDVDSQALDSVLWPLVMVAYYAIARWVVAKFNSTKLSTVLTGPGSVPIYNDIPDEILEKFLREETAVQ